MDSKHTNPDANVPQQKPNEPFDGAAAFFAKQAGKVSVHRGGEGHHTVTILCRCLCVTPSGFYAWRTRSESMRVREDRRLKVLVHASFTDGRGYYGSLRIQDDLVEWGERVSRKRTIRLMQEDGLKARVRKRYKGTTMSDHDQPIAANLLQQEFTAERPNQRWVGDTSELRIGENGNQWGLFDVLGNVWEWTFDRRLPYPTGGRVVDDVEDSMLRVSNDVARTPGRLVRVRMVHRTCRASWSDNVLSESDA